MKKIFYTSILVVLCFFQSFAVDYNASLFGCVSDGHTNNTGSIQYAINYIAKKGGGTLHFYVGRYLTGGIELKSNVTIELHEGAVLLASPSIYDYIGSATQKALLYAKDQSNIQIIGKGVIQGQDKIVAVHRANQASNGYVQAANPIYTPSLLAFENCTDIKVDGLIFQKADGHVQTYTDCKNVEIANQLIKTTENKAFSGIFLSNCAGVKLSQLFVDVAGKALSKDAKTQIISIDKCITPDGKSI